MEKQANVCCLPDNMEIIHSFVQSSDEAIILTNSEGHIFFWNKMAEEIFQYSAEEIRLKSISILLPEKYSKCYQSLKKNSLNANSSIPTSCIK